MHKAKKGINKRRIGLYGGAFDPVHHAHLELARAARIQASLDEVIFIPAARSPLKAHGPIAGDRDRLEMLALALANEACFSVDDLELRRGGVSYSLDTVKHVSARFEGADLFWMIGGDQFAQLDRWHAIGELTVRVTFLVLARPGYELSAPDIPELTWKQIDAPQMEESSTLIRKRLAGGKPVKGLLPEPVEAFIHKKGLYT